MTFLPGEGRPASVSARRRHDEYDDRRPQVANCQCNWLVLIALDETLDGNILGRMVCEDCGRAWVRGPGDSGPAKLSHSLRSEATPSVWKQRRENNSPGA